MLILHTSCLNETEDFHSEIRVTDGSSHFAAAMSFFFDSNSFFRPTVIKIGEKTREQFVSLEEEAKNHIKKELTNHHFCFRDVVRLWWYRPKHSYFHFR